MFAFHASILCSPVKHLLQGCDLILILCDYEAGLEVAVVELCQEHGGDQPDSAKQWQVEAWDMLWAAYRTWSWHNVLPWYVVLLEGHSHIHQQYQDNLASLVGEMVNKSCYIMGITRDRVAIRLTVFTAHLEVYQSPYESYHSERHRKEWHQAAQPWSLVQSILHDIKPAKGWSILT